MSEVLQVYSCSCLLSFQILKSAVLSTLHRFKGHIVKVWYYLRQLVNSDLPLPFIPFLYFLGLISLTVLSFPFLPLTFFFLI